MNMAPLLQNGENRSVEMNRQNRTTIYIVKDVYYVDDSGKQDQDPKTIERLFSTPPFGNCQYISESAIYASLLSSFESAN
jgi:hypothetical protein